MLDTGCRWRDLPEQLGCGSGHTAWRRLREWQDAGVWDRLHQLVLDELSDILGVTGELLSAEQVVGSARGPVTTMEIDLLEEAAAALLTAPSTG